MRHELSVVARCCGLLLIVVIALSLYGCGDVSSVTTPPPPPSPDSQLSQLTVTPGTLNPTFIGTTTSYTVDVTTDITSVTVAAQTQNAGATVGINGSKPTASQQSQSVNLGGPGSSTPISIVVTAPNGTQTTYVVTVNRAALTGNNSLQSLTVSPGTLSPAFNENTLSYSDDVATTTVSVTVTATLQDIHATMTINGQPTNSGQAKIIALGAPGSSTQVAIAVTAQNGTLKTYAVTVNKSGGSNNLQSLTVSPGTLTPAFAPTALSYSDNVAANVTSVTVTPTLVDTNATMTVNGQATNSGQASTIPLEVAGSSTSIFVVVTAPSLVQKTYTITVNRAAFASDNTLSTLSVTGQTLSPAFAPGTLNYTVNVGSGVSQVVVNATKSDPNAVMSGSVTAGAGTASGQATIQLNGPGNPTSVFITVTAVNGTSQNYTITVIRAGFASDNNLSALSVTGQTLNPAFSSSTTSYTVNVGSAVNNVTVSATKSDPNAVMSGDVTAGAGQATGQATIQLNGPGNNTTVLITVTAPNGISKNYTITVIRAAQSSDNNLSALSVTGQTLSPSFSPSTTSYTVNVGSAVSSVQVTATKSDPNAVMSGSLSAGTGQATGQATIQLNGPGNNTTVFITVTAVNGTSKNYTITVIRAALGTNANLSGLVVSAGPLVPAFAAGTLAYTVTAPVTTTGTTVTATVADLNAKLLTINGAGANSGQAFGPIALGPGANPPISIVVTAQDGTTTKTYTVTITVGP